MSGWTTATIPRPAKGRRGPPCPPRPPGGASGAYNGLLFFAGGECRTGTGAKTFDEVEAYDTKGNRWLKFASLPAPRHGFAAAVADDKLFFIAGSGRCGGGDTMAGTP